MVKEGEQAPNFVLPSDRGKNVSLKDFLGKKIVLYFYPKDGTPGCTQEAKEFRDLAEKFSEENTVIIGVSRDSMESHQKFKKRNRLPFTLLSDPEGKVHEAYGVIKEKHLYGRTFMGTERSTFILDETGTVRKIFRNVRAKGHAKTCLLCASALPLP